MRNVVCGSMHGAPIVGIDMGSMYHILHIRVHIVCGVVVSASVKSCLCGTINIYSLATVTRGGDKENQPHDYDLDKKGSEKVEP